MKKSKLWEKSLRDLKKDKNQTVANSSPKVKNKKNEGLSKQQMQTVSLGYQPDEHKAKRQKTDVSINDLSLPSLVPFDPVLLPDEPIDDSHLDLLPDEPIDDSHLDLVEYNFDGDDGLISYSDNTIATSADVSPPVKQNNEDCLQRKLDKIQKLKKDKIPLMEESTKDEEIKGYKRFGNKAQKSENYKKTLKSYKKELGWYGERLVFEKLLADYTNKSKYEVINQKKLGFLKVVEKQTGKEIEINWHNAEGETGEPKDITITEKTKNMPEKLTFIEVKSTPKTYANAKFSQNELQIMEKAFLSENQSYMVYRVKNLFDHPQYKKYENFYTTFFPSRANILKQDKSQLFDLVGLKIKI